MDDPVPAQARAATVRRPASSPGAAGARSALASWRSGSRSARVMRWCAPRRWRCVNCGTLAALMRERAAFALLRCRDRRHRWCMPKALLAAMRRPRGAARAAAGAPQTDVHALVGLAQEPPRQPDGSALAAHGAGDGGLALRRRYRGQTVMTRPSGAAGGSADQLPHRRCTPCTGPEPVPSCCRCARFRWGRPASDAPLQRAAEVGAWIARRRR